MSRLSGLMMLWSFADAAPEVRFVVIGDSQLMRPAQFERMVHEVNLLRPQFVTCTGDMIHGYTDDRAQLRREWAAYRQQLRPLTMPFFPVPGNHDVGTPEGLEIYGEVWGSDRYRYVHDHGHVRCIVLNSYAPGAKDRVLPDQREWLREVLEEWTNPARSLDGQTTTDRAVALFVHSPFWRYDPALEAGYADWMAVENLIVEYPVLLVVAGNTDRHHETMWERRRGIDHVVLTSTGNFPQANERAGYFHAFLHVSIIGRDIRAGLVRPGSILPLDTVQPSERPVAVGHGLEGGVVRLRRDGAAETISIPVRNATSQTRTFRLQWDLSSNSEASIDPKEVLIELAPNEETAARFDLNPTGRATNEWPRLSMSTSSILRSGVVDREWEATYREELSEAQDDPSVMTTSIDLDSAFEFATTFEIHRPQQFRAIRTTTPPEIDGHIDEQVWQHAHELTQFRISGSNEAPAVRTVIRALYDDAFLYLAAYMEEPNPSALKADAHGEIALTWNDDDIEFFFDPQETGRDHTRIFENSAGTRFTGRPIGTPNRYARMDYHSAIVIGEDYWSIELRIPWTDIVGATQPTSGDRWGFNVWRHRQQSTPPRHYWAVDAYQQGRYGVLVFD